MLIQMRVIPIYRLNKFNYDFIQLDAAACPASRAPPLTPNKGTMNHSPVRQPLRLRTMNSGSTSAGSSPATPRSSLAMSVSAALLLLPLGALAQTGGPSGDPRHTRPLAETPQTITVLTKTAIDDAGVTDLKQILGAQPGITLGTGENGNAFGDRYIIRGQEARSDVFVDGLRDPGMSTRESFAIEQLEISKGPNSSFAGRGTAGGAINAITKQATLDHDFTRFSAGVGSDSQKRVTTDVNKGFGDNVALRVNALYGDEDVPDRKPASRERKGIAISGLVEVNKDLSLTLDY